MDQYTLFVILSPLAITIALLVTIYCWYQRSEGAARLLSAVMAASMFYLFFNTLELVDPTPSGTLFFAQVCYLCISVLTVNWLAFSLAFSGHEKVLKSPYFRLLWLIPLITVVLVFTNHYHHLIWKEFNFVSVSSGFLHMRVKAYGTWFWIFWLQSYLLIFSGAALIAWNSFSAPRRANLALAGALLPLIVNMTYVLRLIPGLNKDFSPLSYALSGVFFGVSIFREKLLALPRFARGILIDKMSDGMLTLDTARQVVDFNPAAQRIFEETIQTAPKIGKPFPLLNDYIEQCKNLPEGNLLQTEITLQHGNEEVYYDLQVRPLRKLYKQDVIGYLVSLHAITEHKKLLLATRQLSIEDPLTGVFNRRYFFERMQAQMDYLARPVYCSILMIDIDHFKQVNDSLGHIAGDQVLQAFAQRLHALLRSSDLIGRIGGDEFIVLLPDTRLENAQRLAERLCLQVAAEPVETQDYGKCMLTISIGIAECSASGSNTLQQIIVQADQGLYQAKALGRNRVRIFDPGLGLLQ
jgi:diguanylate cyclase (GGDEF)-like protein